MVDAACIRQHQSCVQIFTAKKCKLLLNKYEGCRIARQKRMQTFLSAQKDLGAALLKRPTLYLNSAC